VTQNLSTIAHSDQARINAADRARLTEVIEYIRSHDNRTALSEMLPDLAEKERAAISSYCRFAHAAVLIFPARLADAEADLRAYDLTVGEVTPSVVVRDRLCRRYGLPPAGLDVRIVHAAIDGAEGQQREIEIFLLALDPDLDPDTELQRIAADERANSRENHVAFEVSTPDPVVLSGLHAMLTGPGGMSCDGGGYNGHEDATVLYFRDANRSSHLHRRLELVTAGRHPKIVQAHLDMSQPLEAVRPGHGTGVESPVNGGRWQERAVTRSVKPRPTPPTRATREDPAAKRLLELMTGAWTTQAVGVAAELSLADHLARYGGATPERLAELTNSDPDCLKRLLRYLASLGIVRGTDDEIQLTELGELLRTDTDHSLHALAQIYGGLFYESFGLLAHTVRTGQPAFERVFGKNHFDHFAAHPQLARLFDRAMAASTAIFTPVAEIIDFSTARVVVDVAGGNGELLGKVLRAAPHLRGVLFERPHVIEAARDKLAQGGCADRCQFVPGDFTETIPGGGDIYLLSRILHDWDDEQGVSILRKCAAAMPAHADLLIIERLLPEDATPSLATAWDIHMMCNVGGRERTGSQYRRMLYESGFELIRQYQLPLDAALLRARRVGSRGRPGTPCGTAGAASPRT
jgi:O-methyltransferase domain